MAGGIGRLLTLGVKAYGGAIRLVTLGLGPRELESGGQSAGGYASQVGGAISSRASACLFGGTPVHTIREASSFSTMYRVHVDGRDALQSDFATLQYSVVNQHTKAVIVPLTTLDISQTLFDSLQQDGRWFEDRKGYNFRHDVDHTLLADPDTLYRFEYRGSLASGTLFYLDPFVIKVDPVFSV